MPLKAVVRSNCIGDRVEVEMPCDLINVSQVEPVKAFPLIQSETVLARINSHFYAINKLTDFPSSR